MHKALLCLTFAALLGSCSSRSPFAVLTVEDPAGVATSFSTLQVGFARNALQPVKVNKTTFPLSVTVTAARSGRYVLWVEPRDAGGNPLGRGKTEARLRSDGTPTATVRLAKACAADPDCNDALFCTGQESCDEGMCAAAGNPCAANVECATSTCVELGSGDGRCDVMVNHLLCGTGSYCNPTRGCVEGTGCQETSDCADGLVCNGEEQCINLVCAPGLPPSVNDGDICTLDGCDDARTGGGAEAVFHVALASLDGSACTIPNTGPPLTPGVCVSSKNGCSESACGDGVTDFETEECDDGNAVETDTCLSACTIARCGDGHILSNSTEVCDDGNTQSGDGCRGDCRKIEVCGDREPDANETCDDGNTNPADGCDGCQRTTWHARAVIGGSLLATAAGLNLPGGIAVDRAGNLFVADTEGHRIRRLAPDGVITTVAGTGTAGSSGDGGQATSAQLNYPYGVAVDGLGNLFVADSSNNRIRKVAWDTRVITTVAGTGTPGFFGDGGQATSARLYYPQGVAVDGLGNLVVADRSNHRIRRIAAGTGVISTIAGTGTYGFSGDDGPAVLAQLYNPTNAAVDGFGNVFVADHSNYRIRRIAAETGVISTIAGNGTYGFSGDGGLATSAQLRHPSGVVADRLGNLFVADESNHRIRKIAAGTGVISTFAGTGSAGFSGDGGAATSARLNQPRAVAVDGQGNVFVADTENHRVRGITAGTGVISTLAGTGTPTFSGDGGAATSAQLNGPAGMAVDGLGNLFLADLSNHRIRRVSAGTEVISTTAGTGTPGFAGDSGTATSAQLYHPKGVAVDELGNVIVTDSANHRIRKIAAGTGVISTLAGTGTDGFSGDGGAATSAQLYYPSGIAIDGDGNVLVADWANHRVRRIVAATGVISTIAGTGTCGFSGDGDDATNAELCDPSGVAVDDLGNVLIAEYSNHCIREIAVDTWVISTIAGTGTCGNSGDGGVAANAQLCFVSGVAVDGLGNVFVADEFPDIRKIEAGTRLISTIVGTGTEGFSGDGGLATSAQINLFVSGVAVDGLGNVLVADSENNRIRRIAADTGVIITVAGQVAPESMGPAAQARVADPRAVALASGDWLFAGGSSGVLQRLRGSDDMLKAVAGRYPHTPALANLARFRDETFGMIGGVAVDESPGIIFITETNRNRLHAVTIVDPDDENTWTIAPLAGDAAAGAAGFGDGTAASARFRRPTGLFLDTAARTLYVADTDNHVIRAINLTTNTVTTPFGTPETLGFFGDGDLATQALLNEPQALTRCPNGDVFVADTGNHRVRRVNAAGIITTVLGDGTAASSGEGSPAWTFPVEEPRGLMCDAFGNLYVTSTSTVRMLPATDAGVVDGEGPVQSIYGAPPRADFPASISECLTGLFVTPDDHVFVTDSCEGLFVELWREPMP